jgi:hypothetical protein
MSMVKIAVSGQFVWETAMITSFLVEKVHAIRLETVRWNA